MKINSTSKKTKERDKKSASAEENDQGRGKKGLMQKINNYLSKIIEEIAREVEKGSSLADAFRPHEKVFGELFINMIEAGEVSGNLETVLNQLYIQTKKQSELTSKVKGALTYPVVLLIVMVLIGIFMMIVVVPKLLGVLSTFGTTLPLPT